MSTRGRYNFRLVNVPYQQDPTNTLDMNTQSNTEPTQKEVDVDNNHITITDNETNTEKSGLNRFNSFGDGRLYKRRKSGGKHQMSACCSCKKKRKKCDGKYPICSACEKLGIDCTMIYIPTGKEIKRSYLEELENTVKNLKQKLQNIDSTSNSAPNSNSELQNSSESGESIFSISSSEEDINYSTKYPPTLVKNRDFAQEVGFISLSAAGDPYYIGETSAYSIAKIISSSINCFPHSQSNSIKNVPNDKTPIYELPFRFPDLEKANDLFNCYKKSVQCQYPFLDWTFAEECFDLIIRKRGKDDIANFFIFMMLAIASQILDSSNNNWTSSYTRSYYKKAFETANSVIDVVNLHTIQAFLLMAVFSQKMPDGISGWQSIGLAIRTAVVLGLHRKGYQKKNEPISNEQKYLQDLKSRIFWSAYGIERINGLVLGRPFSISDIDIDAPFPLEVNETRVACHVVKLRRIQSNIYTFIYKPFHLLEKFEDIDTTRVEILLELNAWMETFPYKDNAASTFETNNWSLISYHNSVLLLLRPVILEISKLKERSPKRFLEWFKVFTESASSICINYKSMHLKKKLSYTWLAMHCCFVGGISFLYCLWLDCSLKVLKWKRQSLVYETISACQTILYIFAERWPSAARFRDSFERLSNIVKSYIDSSSDIGAKNLNINEVIASGVFVDGSIEIDSYLTGKQFQDKFKHRNSLTGGDTDGISFTSSNIDLNHCDLDDDMNSLWEFLDNTGDKYLRDLFNEMEDSMSIFK